MGATVTTRLEDASAELALSGALTVSEARDTFEVFERLAARPKLRSVRVLLSELGPMDAAGAVTLRVGGELLQEGGKDFELVDLRPEYAAIVELLSPADEVPTPPAAGWVERTGEVALGAIDSVERFATMVGQTTLVLLRGLIGRERLRWGAMIEQGVVIGVDAAPMVAMLAALVGVVLAFQGQYQLEKFGADIFMAELVSLGMVREFGPFVTAIILAGRTGASISAEIGTMSVHEELDALSSMGVDLHGYLVLPRLAGITLVAPLLVTVAMVAGLGAGIAVAGFVELPAETVFTRMQLALRVVDFTLAFVKSVAFAWIVASVGCFVGLGTRGGAHEVGRSATRAVVLSIIAIIVADSVLTSLWTVHYGG